MSKIESQIKVAKEIVSREIVDEMRESYLDYAMSVIVSRALPDVRDGLKPVHRRILYSMYEMGLKHSSSTKKSSAIVGYCLGRYHPHGDTSVYYAMVGLAQDFVRRYPLVIGQGNFGCFTGDTKVRLCDGRKVSFKKLIAENKKGVRHWGYSFNHKTKEVELAEIKNPRRTRNNEKIIQITLDNGEKIKCTLDHKFLLKNGKYCQAKNLKPGDSLMPLYLKTCKETESLRLKGYEMVYQPKKHSWDFVQRHNNCVSKRETALNHLDSFEEIIDESKIYNHRVVSIKLLRKREDVYDITVDPWHNFALGADVFVHNSIDSDPPAAPRYTEAKLAPFGEDIMADIEKATVDFVDNYDGTFKEPSVLPSPAPQILLNGTIGIAVGMATNILPHNLNELCDALNYLVDNPDATTEDLFQFIKGPDLPTGGIIYGQGELISTYSQGKGVVLNRGRAEIVEKGKGAQIVVTEIPYRVNKAALVAKIADLAGQDKIKGIKGIRDESDREGLRIVLDVSPQGFPQRILNQLYRYTDLEKKHYINMVALVDGIQPRVLSLVDILTHYLNHRREVVVRRTKFDLDRALKRQHILEGLIIALAHIDEVIAVIKKSEDRADAARNLIKKFKLSEAQAEAILEIKLHRLAKLERIEIENELKDIEKKIKEWKVLLASPKKVEKVIQQELEAMKKKHGDERKTEIVAGSVKQISKKDLIPEQENFIIITQKGYIKRNQPEVYKLQKRGGRGIVGMKTIEGDIVEHFISVSTHDQLLFFTDTGKVYDLPAYEIEEGSRVSRGRGLANYLPIESDERVLSVLDQKTEAGQNYLVMATKKGMIKRTDKKEYQNIRKSGLQAIKLKKGDWLKAVAETSGEDQIMIVTQKGKSILFSEKGVRATGRVTAGVRGISLGKDDEVIGLAVVKNGADLKKIQILTLSEKGYGKRTALSNYRKQSRGGKGIITANLGGKIGDLIFAKLIENEDLDLIVVSAKGNIIRTKVKTVSVLGRATSGVRTMKLAAGDKVVSAACLLEENKE